MECTRQNNDINVFKVVRELFNELRSNFVRKERKRCRIELHKKEVAYNILKGKRARR